MSGVEFPVRVALPADERGVRYDLSGSEVTSGQVYKGLYTVYWAVDGKAVSVSASEGSVPHVLKALGIIDVTERGKAWEWDVEPAGLYEVRDFADHEGWAVWASTEAGHAWAVACKSARGTLVIAQSRAPSLNEAKAQADHYAAMLYELDGGAFVVPMPEPEATEPTREAEWIAWADAMLAASPEDATDVELWTTLERAYTAYQRGKQAPETAPSPAATPQPPPTGDGPRVLDLVLADLTARAEVGREKYGTYLRAGNGRDALMDAYQEALDLCMYLRQAMMERDGVKVPEAPEPRFYPSQLTDFFARMRSIALTLDSDTNNPNSNDCATIAQDIERALGLSWDGEGHTVREVQTPVPPLFGVVFDGVWQDSTCGADLISDCGSARLRLWFDVSGALLSSIEKNGMVVGFAEDATAQSLAAEAVDLGAIVRGGE